MDDCISLTRRQALALGALPFLTPASVQAAEQAPVLVELFTSQGCSSCPPADKLAAELAQDPQTFVVSFNVDYWDYLGWRDTLAKPEYSQRQYDYAKSRGDGAVYTPQMVINGAAHVVGSNQRDVSRLLDAAKGNKLLVPVQIEQTATEISVSIAASSVEGNATLWLMAVAPLVKQKIVRGENSGKDVAYVNVVRNLVPAAMWNGEAYHGRWMRNAVLTQDSTFCLAVLQKDKTGPVLGLARTL